MTKWEKHFPKPFLILKLKHFVKLICFIESSLFKLFKFLLFIVFVLKMVFNNRSIIKNTHSKGKIIYCPVYFDVEC